MQNGIRILDNFCHVDEGVRPYLVPSFPYPDVLSRLVPCDYRGLVSKTEIIFGIVDVGIGIAKDEFTPWLVQYSENS